MAAYRNSHRMPDKERFGLWEVIAVGNDIDDRVEEALGLEAPGLWADWRLHCRLAIPEPPYKMRRYKGVRSYIKPG